jgi:L-threonylcarbamoyladenylate synthase
MSDSKVKGGAPLVSVAEAARLLRASGLLVFPTETFFALGGLAADASAVRRVYAVKMRPASSPLPILAATMAQVAAVVRLDTAPLPLLQRFWPGALTVLLPAQATLPAALVNAQGKAAVRISPHPWARAVALAAGGALTASSANISGHSPAQSVQQLEPALLARVDAVLRGCPRTAGGLPSTLVEPCGKGLLRILRHGAVQDRLFEQAGYTIIQEEAKEAQ